MRRIKLVICRRSFREKQMKTLIRKKKRLSKISCITLT